MSLIQDFHFMKIALKEANFAFQNNEIPIGAVLIHNNIIIARTHNLTKSLNNTTAHAEILAINLASIYLNKNIMKECTLYVTLEPCMMCAGAIYWARIGKIVSGAFNSKGFSCYGFKFHPNTEYIPGILKKPCKTILKYFFFLKRIQNRKNKKIL